MTRRIGVAWETGMTPRPSSQAARKRRPGISMERPHGSEWRRTVDATR